MSNYLNDVMQNLMGNIGSDNNALTSFIPNKHKWLKFGLNTLGGNIPGIGGGIVGGMDFGGGGGFGMAANKGMFQTPMENPNAYLELFGNPHRELLNNLLGKRKTGRHPIYGFDYMN